VQHKCNTHMKSA